VRSREVSRRSAWHGAWCSRIWGGKPPVSGMKGH